MDSAQDEEEIPVGPLLTWLDEERGRGASLAKSLGSDQGLVTNWKRRGAIPGNRLPKVSDLMGITPDEYLRRAGRLTGGRKRKTDESDFPSVPVVGTAQLGDDGYWHELDYPVGHGEGFITYPTRDKNAYALRVKGDSMRPRIKPGEFVVILPNHSIPPGEEVMVKTKDGRCMIKRLGARRGGLVELLSVNEDHRPITLDEGQIEKLHYVAAIVKDDLYRTAF